MAKSSQTPTSSSTALLDPPSQSQEPQKPVIKPLKFRLLVGQHAGLNKNLEDRLWQQGDIVECYKRNGQPFDLAKRFNQPDAIKFQSVHADMPSSKGLKLVEGNPEMDDEQLAKYEEKTTPRQQTKNITGNDDIFEAMTTGELQRYIEENEISVEGESRDALLESIRQFENANSVRNV